MSFYTSIHPWYDEIFPYSEVQRDFVLSYGSDVHLSAVDAGCGTGSLIVSLAKVFQTTAGIDPDQSMLETARKKAAFEGAGTWFFQTGMLDLTREFPSKSIDRLICFGNTLPHLTNENEVEEFARQMATTLKPGGKAMIQIINYDRIVDQKLAGLPTIENDNFRFERLYHYPENPTHVLFHSRLTLKTTGVVVENEVPLLAIRPAKLKQILMDSGFSGIEEFGSFKKEVFTPDSQSYIIMGAV